ncbi:hypothetical protein KTO58_09465 [Chitinophaga pendula]|uniref:hypothetical protein n=1 Tax=Chitinophaga TaxID=79328 RepID=UPI000BAEB189|nr:MULTISPECIES: hypothetical protein [Chitinophaga]ASZ12977.1 hypothetical protein CK934_19440 [Chitinophaga sp. MD30]UCJ09391.1 hypothetical protein KTO58_09465 [Chitinophaga pendula]
MKKMVKPMIGLAVAAGFLFASIDSAKASKAEVSTNDINVTVDETLAATYGWHVLFGSSFVLVTSTPSAGESAE